MSFRQFDTTKMEEAKKKYAEEAKQRWGGTVAYAEYEKRRTVTATHSKK